MRVKKTCPVCGIEFFATNKNQRYDKRKCFKVVYNQKIREERRKERLNPTRALRTCEFCGLSYHIPFDPVKQHKLFDEFCCVHCGVSNDMIWRNMNDPNSHQTIFQAVVQMRQGNTSTTYTQVIRFN